jgi:hypothetical protein
VQEFRETFPLAGGALACLQRRAAETAVVAHKVLQKIAEAPGKRGAPVHRLKEELRFVA